MPQVPSAANALYGDSPSSALGNVGLKRPDPMVKPEDTEDIDQNRPDIWGPQYGEITRQQAQEKSDMIMEHLQKLMPKDTEEGTQARKNLAQELHDLNQKHISEFEKKRDETFTPSIKEEYQKDIDRMKQYNPFKDFDVRKSHHKELSI
jgi:hypothetical protein